MNRLSAPPENLKPHYTAVVVGSGYGGGIAASRLSRAGQSVCVLERGRELHPGAYPNTLETAREQMQLSDPLGHQGSRLGLYDFRVSPGLSVFLGCGLGGTSLVNANVGLEADPRVFDDPAWPAEIRSSPGALAEGVRLARAMLRPVPYPDDFPALPKLRALGQSAAGLGAAAARTPIYVTFQDGVNHVGVEQRACQLCGDCVSGCNYGAKNTILMNYLPDARSHGAEIFTQVDVRLVRARDPGGWEVHYQPLATGDEPFDAPASVVTADIVVLAAGALGSTEILLRSGEAGLPLSDQVGRRFNSNGDLVGFAYNTEVAIHAVGFGGEQVGVIPPVGPCITGVIDLRAGRPLADGMIVEEGSFPGPLAAILPGVMALAARLGGQQLERGVEAMIRENEREIEGLRGAHQGALDHSQIFLVMGHDRGDGRLELAGGSLAIDWPFVGSEPNFVRADATLLEGTRPLGGTYMRDPIWKRLLGRELVTVHPLGGCAMGDTGADGTVNHKGQVFSGADAAVHDGLYVCDGAVVPTTLGVNPTLTISALAERCCALMARDRGWSIDYALPGDAS